MSNIADTEAQCNPRVVAENLLGNIQWIDDTKGFCTCPGEHSHTGTTRDHDCMVHIDGVATIFCLHSSCLENVQDANRQLRSAIREGSTPVGCQTQSSVERKRQARETEKTELLERKARGSLDRILKEYRWSYDQIGQDTKSSLSENPRDHWRNILGLFEEGDMVWAGNMHDTGKPKHASNFRSAGCWLAGEQPQGMLTCPASFRSNSISRSNDNVLHRRFLVVESDVLSRDQVGAVFKWLRDEVGLNLRAVVDTAGKSLHAWFDYPKAAVVDQLRVVLPQLGCDPGLFRPSQPCRLPGALRDGRYQKLIYLAPEERSSNPKIPGTVLPLPNIFYDGQGQCYWRENNAGGWHKINENSLEIELIASGYDQKPEGSAPLSEVRAVKRKIQLSQDIIFAGPLAGYRSGIQNIQGQRILVTSSPQLITPEEGCWPTLHTVLEGLLGEDPNQLPCLYGWLKQAYSSLRSGNLMYGQALCVAGPAGCGKSLLQTLITQILGGRSAKPYLALTGKTSFNADHFAGEHLMIEDEVASVDIRARREFGSAIKKITANETQSCHPKNKTALILTPFWRLSITVNDEPVNLHILPPLEDGIEDKLIILKARKSPMPMPTGAPAERRAFWDRLESELPAFIHYLQNWTIPEDKRDSRYGIKTYQNPAIVDLVTNDQPEERLLAMIDQELFPVHIRDCPANPSPTFHRPIAVPDDWIGTAERLAGELMKIDSIVRHEAGKLFYYPGACGTLLAKLSASHPNRVSSPHLAHGGSKVWNIKAPVS